jgi:ABC-type oligopeptide transport system ATPase subunit
MTAVMERRMTAVMEAVGVSKHFQSRRGCFGADRGAVRAVDDISFAIEPGKTSGVVGESGCGKTTTAKLVLGLESPTGGAIRFEGRDLTELDKAGRRNYRKSVQAVFQDPFASLNPRMRIGAIIAEPLTTNEIVTPADVRRRVLKLLDLVGLSKQSAGLFPHEFSGGQRQRIAIARALSLSPKLVVLDEPVSALDVSIRAQILNLLRDLQDEMGLSYFFIAHDLAAVAAGPSRRAARRYYPDRRGSKPTPPAIGMPVPSALPARHASLFGRGTGAGGSRRA